MEISSDLPPPYDLPPDYIPVTGLEKLAGFGKEHQQWFHGGKMSLQFRSQRVMNRKPRKKGFNQLGIRVAASLSSA